MNNFHNDYHNAGRGLRLMFTAKIGSIICVVLMLIPVINILAAIGSLAFMVVSIVGLYMASKDLEGCKTAFTLTIVQLLVSLFTCIPSSGLLGTVITLIDDVLSLLVVYFVCMSVGEALEYTGCRDIAQQGYTVWKINLSCTLISIILSVLALIPVINILAMIASLVVLVAALIGSILFLIFLHKSGNALE